MSLCAPTLQPRFCTSFVCGPCVALYACWSIHQPCAGLPSLEAVAQHFEAAEERSLGLLTYANDLQAEVEALEDHVAGLRAELARLQRPAVGEQDALTEVWQIVGQNS